MFHVTHDLVPNVVAPAIEVSNATARNVTLNT